MTAALYQPGARITVRVGGLSHRATVLHTWRTRVFRRLWLIVHVDHLGEKTIPARDVTGSAT